MNGIFHQDYILFDDFTYVSQVPEPAALGLFGFGLLGLGALRRRKGC